MADDEGQIIFDPSRADFPAAKKHITETLSKLYNRPSMSIKAYIQQEDSVTLKLGILVPTAEERVRLYDDGIAKLILDLPRQYGVRLELTVCVAPHKEVLESFFMQGVRENLEPLPIFGHDKGQSHSR
jgi:hypothetical protein